MLLSYTLDAAVYSDQGPGRSGGRAVESVRTRGRSGGRVVESVRTRGRSGRRAVESARTRGSGCCWAPAEVAASTISASEIGSEGMVCSLHGRVATDPEPRLAQVQQRFGEGAPFRELGAERDVPHEGEERVPTHGGARLLPRQLGERLGERRLAVRERVRVPAHAQALLRDVAQAVADVERRVALAVEIEVEEIEAPPVHHRVIGVEVAVDAAAAPARNRVAEAIAGLQQPLEARPPFRPCLRHGGEAPAQDAVLVDQRVPASGLE